ncbi:adipocyte plasma membrane-associated protein-like [Salvelinus alpinus]
MAASLTGDRIQPGCDLTGRERAAEGFTMLGKRAILVVLLSVAVGVYLLPSPIDPQPYIFKGPPPLLEGPLAVNTRLQNGRRLFIGQLHGPESFTADQEGNVYTGTVDGKLWRIHQETLTLITHMGQDLQECGQ